MAPKSLRAEVVGDFEMETSVTQQPEQQTKADSLRTVDVAPAMAGHVAPELAPTEAVFELKDVEVSYSGNTAVREISFDIFQERITALIGPTSSRKPASRNSSPPTRRSSSASTGPLRSSGSCSEM